MENMCYKKQCVKLDKVKGKGEEKRTQEGYEIYKMMLKVRLVMKIPSQLLLSLTFT